MFENINSDTIKKIKESRDLTKFSETSIPEISFRIKDLDISSEGIYVKDKKVTDKGLLKILSELNIKKGILENFDGHSNDWEVTKETIQSLKSDIILYGHGRVGSNDEQYINNIYSNHQTDIEDVLDYDRFFDFLINALSITDIKYDMNDFNFDIESKTFDMSFLESENTFNISNDDIWKPGKYVKFDVYSFKILPFFNRLICSNGISVKSFGFESNIQQQKHSYAKIDKILRNAFSSHNNDTNDLIQGFIHDKMNKNISVREYLSFINTIKKYSKTLNGKYDGVIEKFLGTDFLFGAYQLDINNMSKGWKSTADTNINAYDFINTITYIATQTDETEIEKPHAVELQIMAGDFLVKEKLDLDDIAPIVEFK